MLPCYAPPPSNRPVCCSSAPLTATGTVHAVPLLSRHLLASRPRKVTNQSAHTDEDDGDANEHSEDVAKHVGHAPGVRGDGRHDRREDEAEQRRGKLPESAWEEREKHERERDAQRGGKREVRGRGSAAAKRGGEEQGGASCALRKREERRRTHPWNYS